MADVKISALPAATTPLTGGEVLPVVQSGVTTKVAVSNLTAGLAGTASININGTVGATTPATGAFTSGTFSTTLGVAGIVTMPAQPAFLATSAGQANVTGNGTLATLAFTTEVFDQGNNFASSTFTAPVTGKYALFASVTAYELATNHTEQNFQIVTSNRTYKGEYFVYALTCPFTSYSYKIAVLADMDAGDTAVVKLGVAGGSLVVDIEVGEYSRFSGFLQS